MNHHYCVWMLNEVPNETTGVWYWTRAMELTSTQAKQVVKMKWADTKTVDEWKAPELVVATAKWGHPHGKRIYDDACVMSGNARPKEYELLVKAQQYWKTQSPTPKQIQEDLNRLFEKYQRTMLLGM